MLTFYTVQMNRKGYPVKFIDPVTCSEGDFTCGSPGGFRDPGEASQEFKASRGHETCCYLESAQFTKKVNAIRDMQAKMKTWNQQKGA